MKTTLSFSENTSQSIDVFHNSASLKGSNRDDALLLASFADTASKISPTPGSKSNALNPLVSSCQFPPLPDTKTNAIAFNFNASRPRAISYSPNEVQNSKMPILLMPASFDRNEQVQVLPQLAMKPRVITPQHQQEQPTVVCRTILRKKFSWKHYPPLEDFLIANREEYLRHSTLNYTLQQKKYNNMLTEQMIQLAAQHRLVFDKNEFSFVTVRDRIRCYYKSYVQSLKKRGIVCGYAARKAGLISKEEMNKNASTKAKIFVPN